MEERFKAFGWILGFACIVALAFLGLGAMIGYQRGVSSCRGEVVTDTVVVRDTVTIDLFHTDTIVKTRLVPYTFTIHDTVDRVDSVLVELPIESHHTHIEDTADIWYSGFAAMIDSVKIYNHTTTIMKTERVEVAKTPLLTLDMGAGAMYREKNINPYLVGEMRCNARKTTWGAYGAIDQHGKWGAGLNVTYRIDIIR